VDATAGEVCARKVGMVEARPEEVSPAEVRPPEVRPAEVRLAEVRLAEVRLAEVRTDVGLLGTPFQVATPFLSIATCSSFAMEAPPECPVS